MQDAEQNIALVLLQINAVKLNTEQPFTWASGIKSPIYCDNRVGLSHVTARNSIVQGLLLLTQLHYPQATVICGVATAGISWGVLLANALNLPFVYCRPAPKAHGMGNQIEGELNPKDHVVIVEDLISTGKSSLQVVEILRNTGCNILGMVSIFTYGFEVATLAFAQAKVALYSLTNYPTLLQVAVNNGYINTEQLQLLNQFSTNPTNWQFVKKG